MPNEESIFDCVLTLQDSYNAILSAEIDDYEAFVDSFLVLYGVDVDTEDVANMKENRVLAFPFENAKAEWLTKNINDAQVENILKRIQDNIYRISQCPDFSSENFVSGVSSGVAIRFKLSGIETRTAPVEAEFKKALQRRIELIAGVAALKMGEEVFRDIQITFKRNLPEDNASLANLVNSLKGTVSDKTLLSMLPFVSDVNAEYEAIQEQKQANMAMYSFGNTAEDTEDDI
jgi:SPP1 family phage portal protein